MRLGKYLLALLLTLSGVASAGTCGNGYSFKKLLVIPPTSSLGLTTDLTNFPAAFCFNGACNNSYTLTDLKTVGNGGQIQNTANNGISRSGPADLVFADAASGGNCLKYEVASYTATSGEMEAHVQIPTLSHTSINFVWMFYGNAGVATTQQDLTLWSDASFLAVYHYPNGASLDAKDSVGSFNGTINSATATTGALDGAAALSGSSQNITAGLLTSATTNITLEAMVNNTGGSQAGVLFENGNGSNGYNMAIINGACGNGTTVQLVLEGIACNGVSAGYTLANGWNHVAVTRGASTWTLYGNGVSTGTGSTNPNIPTTRSTVGSTGSNGAYVHANVDEVRFSSVSRTTDWVVATSSNLISPTGFSFMLDIRLPAGMTSGAYCVPVTIDHTKVPNTDATNFQMLFRGYYSWMADTSNGGFAVVGNSGHDIRWFSNSSCSSALTFERVYWTNTTGDSAWRVLIPTVSHTVDTTVYLKIGSSSDTSDLSSGPNVWSSFYNGAYQLGSPTSLGLSDDGGEGLTLSACGVGAGVSSVATPFGGGAYIPDNNSCLNTSTSPCSGASPYPCGGSSGSITGWMRAGVLVNPTNCSTGCNAWGYGKGNGTGERAFNYSYYANSVRCSGMSNTGQSCASNGNVAITEQMYTGTPIIQPDMAWHRFDFVHNGGAISGSALYIDSVLVGAGNGRFYETNASGTDTLNTDTGGEFNIGRNAAHAVAWCQSCMVALPRVTTTALTADRIASEFNNESSPFTFYSFGTASSLTPAGGSTQQLIPGIITRNNWPLGLYEKGLVGRQFN
jgi:hypothetical protein